MNRRDALKLAGAMVGGAYIAVHGGVTACGRGEARSGALSAEEEELIEEIADTLLPTTASSPGAKAAGVGPVMNLLLTDCRPVEAQEVITRGLGDFRIACSDRYGTDFTRLPRTTRERLVRELDAEAQQAGSAHYFHLLRDLALQAYFSTEVGLTQALRYNPVPGRWIGCVPLEPGQPAWA